VQGRRSIFTLFYLIVYVGLVYITGVVQPIGSGNGDMLLTLFSGGTLVAAFFLLGDTAVGPKTPTGIAASVIICAALSWLFRYVFNMPYGALSAVACVNMLYPLIRWCESSWRYERPETEDIDAI
jgi:Na+-translocating ferredoxin:NAD+ oxidoreductase RnfD subunit